MGANDTGEQLAAAIEDNIRLEAENARLEAKLAQPFAITNADFDRAVDAFKRGWRAADEQGLEGRRTRTGLNLVLFELGITITDAQ